MTLKSPYQKERSRQRYEAFLRAIVLGFMTTLLIAFMLGVVALADLVL
ncbi:protein of unknown function DUF2700 [Streptomyces phage Dagobah]|nr:protein of unknown function DUF2700 [Streptomyces phage Dagobah]